MGQVSSMRLYTFMALFVLCLTTCAGETIRESVTVKGSVMPMHQTLADSDHPRKQNEQQPFQLVNDRLTLTLPNKVRIEFPIYREHLVGMDAASIGGHALSSSQSLRFPILAEEFAADPRIATVAELTNYRSENGMYIIEGQLRAQRGAHAIKDYFLTTSTGAIHRDSYDLAQLQLPANFSMAQRKTLLIALSLRANPSG